MLDGIVRALPELGIGGLLLLAFALLVYRGPLYMGRTNERRKNDADASTRAMVENNRIATEHWARLQSEIDRLESRIDVLEKKVAECEEERDSYRHRAFDAEAEVMRLRARDQGFGEARQDAQSFLSAERTEDAKKRGKPNG